MPLFDYKCIACGHTEIDVLIYLSMISGDFPVLACPICESPMKRMIGSAHPQFKGSGFYTTDYTKKPRENE